MDLGVMPQRLKVAHALHAVFYSLPVDYSALLNGDIHPEPFPYDLLEDLGLGGRLGHKPSELSGGEQQRVAIARALVNSPAILFADEPSGNLDSASKADLHNLFFSLRDKYGQTIIIVTHDPSLAEMCDRVLYMKDGLFVSKEESGLTPAG